MKRWLVTYQDVPFAMNYGGGALIVEAETIAQAFAVAYDRLTHKGHAVFSEYGALGWRDNVITSDDLVDLGIPVCGGRTHIRTIVPYAPRITGKVVAE